MTARKRALRFNGDRTDDFHVGQAMGPGTDGFYRRVTAITFDRVRKATLVELEVQEVAGEGQRLRYHGNADGTDDLPPDRAPLHDEVTPR